MATTTNFGWETPDDTDLVKDGAAAIRTLGSAIDTSLVDLKGGTTGQVLSKTSNTDMDFTWVTSDDANAIQNAIVDAKGDLIAASAADTPARLAVGNNGETLVADSSASVGLRYSAATGQNPIINSAFDIWQRGTSFSVAANTMTYTADRWITYQTNSSSTISRQSTNDTTNLPSIQYCARVQRNSGQTWTTVMQLAQNFENVSSTPYIGKAVTISFYARKGADFSSASSLLNVRLYSGTGTDQNLLQLYTGAATPINESATLTTTWQRFSFSGTVSSSATEIAPYFFYTPSGTAGAADYYEITGVQLDIGSVALPFRRSAATLAGELDACKRYAQNINYSLSGKNVYNTVANGSATGATSSRITLYLPVPMRVAPTSVTFTASGFVLDNVASAPTVTGVTINQGGTDTVLLTVDASAGALTNKDPVIMYANNNSSANLILSAEL